eukprot:m.129121 g.129121  ORF g.129121 m.129121 type:complete len:561 (-) comp11252_c0_seq14:899-2581(-)
MASTVMTGVLVLVASLLMLSPGASPMASSPHLLREPSESPVALYTDGVVDDKNRSWACVRCPALLVAPDGSLLAFGGGKTSCADNAVGFRVLLRRSHDNGTTWGGVQSVAGDDTTTGGYIAPIVDRQRGVVLVLYNRRFSEVWLTRSLDSGRSFSASVNITDTVGPVAVGPPGGVQLHSGRLVVAVHGANGTMALFSDDGGETWQHGSPVGFSRGVVNGGESQLIDDLRGPNTLSMLIRVSSPNVLENHAIAQSDDGGQSWNTNATLIPVATGPTCQGSIARLPTGDLLVSAPHWQHWRYPQDRRNMTVWLLQTTNTSAPTALATTSVFSGPAAYSSLSADGRFILFEGGDTYRYASLLFAPVGLDGSSLPAVADHKGLCLSDLDCGLLGTCTNGACRCFRGYRGSTCAELDLVPAPPTAGLRQQGNRSNWCGTILQDATDATLWHMYNSDFAGCGLGIWITGSRVIHTTSHGSPLGPYTPTGEVAVAGEAHNPQGTLCLTALGAACEHLNPHCLSNNRCWGKASCFVAQTHVYLTLMDGMFWQRSDSGTRRNVSSDGQL